MSNRRKNGEIIIIGSEGWCGGVSRKRGGITTEWAWSWKNAKRYRSWNQVNQALIRLKEAGYTRVGYLVV